MLDVKVEVEGARQFRAAATAAGKDAVDDLKAANKSAADVVKTAALPIVPVLTGDLKSSLRTSGTKTAGVVRAASARVPWGPPIHWGWEARNIAPRPFLYKALDSRREQVMETYIRQVDQVIRKHGL